MNPVLIAVLLLFGVIFLVISLWVFADARTKEKKQMKKNKD